LIGKNGGSSEVTQDNQQYETQSIQTSTPDVTVDDFDNLDDFID
jgi:hypothetical protein